MPLTIREVRVPTPRVRAERLRAAMEAHGNVEEYKATGAINPNDGVALLQTAIAGQAMTLADGAVAGETMLIECVKLNKPGTDTVVVTPANLTGGTTITFSNVGERIVLIWDTAPVTPAWTPRGGATAVVA